MKNQKFNKTNLIKSIFIFIQICLLNFVFAEEFLSIDTKNIPLIQNPQAKDLIFRQFTEEADHNAQINPVTSYYNKGGEQKKTCYTFYKLKVPSNMDFIWLSARLSPVYRETIATLNRLSSADEKISGKTLLVCTFSGIFIPAKPNSAWEQLLYKQYFTSGKIDGALKFKIDGEFFYFIEKEHFDSTTFLFFVDTNMISPLKQSVLTSEYGYRISPISGKWKFHSGVDLAAPEGTDVFCCKAGEVSTTGFNSTYGNFIIIQHYNGMTSVYAHLSKILVKKGTKINGGTVIAKVGTTGASTGPHLHFELRKNGSTTDPGALIDIR